MRILVLMLGAALTGCAAVTVHTVGANDFGKYSIPRKIAVARLNDTSQTARLAGDMSEGLAKANFNVVDAAYLEGLLAANELTLKSLINSNDYRALRDVAGIEGVMLVREFFGIEVHFVETENGREIASGCWRTGYINVINDVIEQIRKKKPSPRLCPVKMQ